MIDWTDGVDGQCEHGVDWHLSCDRCQYFASTWGEFWEKIRWAIGMGAVTWLALIGTAYGLIWLLTR
jgi:hypothetical protein